MRRRGRRSIASRRAFGNFASAMQQRDSTNVVISVQEDVNINVPVGSSEATLIRNVNAILTSTQYFENYMGMYDQYKVNAVRASLEMTFIGNGLLNSATFPSICTAWDRNGVKIKVVEVNGTKYFGVPDYGVVSSYSSANEKTLYYGILSQDNMYSAWNPQLLISLKAPQAVAAMNACTLTIHWQFDVTLRGLRKVLVPNAEIFKPYAGFIGYAKNNMGLVVPSATDASGYIVVGNADNSSKPSINPDTVFNATDSSYTNGGIVLPNNGMPESNPNL
ncbi:hypothetical protein EDI_192750 [Entamoeba dispar SAW760]|uniref:Uncharacterized protein n=1 Tax=Entamoeba dispar (strain ATCC PRA-260 / SAW760) TaxID=370354 RepID=B0EH25_ENTDS|nr:uncharacterized protein EDI_192750 [Entamoeba dispar SAW760]EDR26174.1 hypothetical protein EDI_192750 [Entamoeba dispar SAW760]|eukprot:EDR26174.1 hypothetical protein EDI_192750 [Entamoeba dispar SAW760]